MTARDFSPIDLMRIGAAVALDERDLLRRAINNLGSAA